MKPIYTRVPQATGGQREAPSVRMGAGGASHYEFVFN